MTGVGTASAVARPRVSGAMRMRLGAAMAPSWIGLKSDDPCNLPGGMGSGN
jgi:hypothetical protein